VIVRWTELDVLVSLDIGEGATPGTRRAALSIIGWCVSNGVACEDE
jgi:hypothetical protein